MVSRSVTSDSAILWAVACQAPLSLLQGIFPTQGLNCISYVFCIGRQIIYYSSTWEARKGADSRVAADLALPTGTVTPERAGAGSPCRAGLSFEWTLGLLQDPLQAVLAGVMPIHIGRGGSLALLNLLT